MTNLHRHPRARRHPRGLSLVEAIAASLIVALLLVATMRLVGGTARSTQMLSERTTAGELADGLIAEILTKPYADPLTPTVFGLDAGETSTSKANYDDVDDYNGWTQTSAYTGRSATTDNLTATVVVSRATLATPSVDAATETGLKHIRVTVTRQGRTVTVRDAWKANAP